MSDILEPEQQVSPPTIDDPIAPPTGFSRFALEAYWRLIINVVRIPAYLWGEELSLSGRPMQKYGKSIADKDGNPDE